MKWIIDNKEWVFSGIGVAILGWLFFRSSNKQVQKGGNNSKNIQVGGNLNINENKDDK
jgi:hypothetical protein